MSSAAATTPPDHMTRREIFTIATLCYLNIINYMDRYCIAGVIVEIQDYYHIGDDYGGLLQTAFVVAYMLAAPVFGYLGDRYSRRLLLMLSCGLWSLMTLLSSFAPNYICFFFGRAGVGIGESGFTAIAPTLISDIVLGDARILVYALFYFAIPVGTGFGYVLSSNISKYAGHWWWGLRATPFMGCIGIILLYFGSFPERGEKEAAVVGASLRPASAYKDDLRYLAHNASFVLSTAALTCVSFIAGALGWWAPKCLYYCFQLQSNESDRTDIANVNLQFGLITVITGLVGVAIGSGLSKLFRLRKPAADPIICGIGMLTSAPLLYGSLYICPIDKFNTFVTIFFAQIGMNFNWAIVADLLMYVVIPTRRASAEALQMLTSHAFGDGISPYMVGLVSEYFKENMNFDKDNIGNSTINGINEIDEFYGLKYSLMIFLSLMIVCAILFFIDGFYIVEDRLRAENDAFS